MKKLLVIFFEMFAFFNAIFKFCIAKNLFTTSTVKHKQDCVVEDHLRRSANKECKNDLKLTYHII